MADVLIGLGGNLGEVPAAIAEAVRQLGERGVAILARSRLYRTTPWGPVAQPDFVNGCALGRTTLTPDQLLAVTQGVERDLGRQAGPRWGPRPIDLDILAYDDVVSRAPSLTLPHPRLTERAFVLVPLAEIAPRWVIDGRPVTAWRDRAGRDGVTPLDTGLPAEAV